MRQSATPVATILRVVLIVDAVVFLSAALFNLGVIIPLGFTELSFPVPIWQAGIGEAIIGLLLLWAGVTGSFTLSWVAFVMSVAGILFGLSSSKVQGPARDIHIVLVPLAIIVFGLLLWLWQQRRQLHGNTPDKNTVR